MPVLHEIKVDFMSLSREFPGKWVALDPESGEVLVVGATVEEISAMVAEKKIEDPLITKISADYSMYVSCTRE